MGNENELDEETVRRINTLIIILLLFFALTRRDGEDREEIGCGGERERRDCRRRENCRRREREYA